MSFGDYWEDYILDTIIDAKTHYLAVSTADPGEDGSTIAEPSGNGYARKAITFGSSSGGTKSNSAAVEFDTATGSWGTLTYGAIFDAVTSGNFCGSSALTASKSITTGQTLRFPIGDVDVTLN